MTLVAGKPKRPNRRNAGSAIILVIVVLVALMLIGTVFLMTSWSEKKAAAAYSSAAPMNAVVDDILDRISAQLADDLYIDGADGPYSDGGADDPRAYIDYPSADPNDAAYDPYLASTELAWADGGGSGAPVAGGRWPKISDVFGLGRVDFPNPLDVPDRRAFVRNQDPYRPFLQIRDMNGDGIPEGIVFADLATDGQLTAFFCEDTDGDAIPDPDQPDGAPLVLLVDTDGDDVRDAYLFPTGSFAPDGEQYYAAVRVIDLGGLVNINTGYGWRVPTPGPLAWMPLGQVTPGNLPTEIAIGGATNDRVPALPVVDLHNLRRVVDPVPPFGSLADWGYYNVEVVRRAENPRGSGNLMVRLFDWSDELACRWRGRFPYMWNCRLSGPFALFDPDTRLAMWRQYAPHLTTFSAGRVLPRPERNGLPGWARPRAKVDLNMPLGTPEQRWTALHAYKNAFNQLLPASTADRPLTTLQMAVNLIDFRDGDDVPTVIPGGAVSGIVSERVMGVEPQPFITQVWYKVTRIASVPGPGTEVDLAQSYVALVLYNPYASPINLEDWEIRIGSNAPLQFPADTWIAPQQRYVIRSDAAVDFLPGVDEDIYADLVDILDVTIVDDDDRTIYVYRPGVYMDGTVSLSQVPVGRFEKDDFSVDPDPDTGAGEYFCNMRRDDDPQRYHMALAVYSADAAATDYTNVAIGNANQLTDAERQPVGLLTVPPIPVFVRGYGGTGNQRIANLADVGRILTVGPRVSASDPPEPLDVRLASELNLNPGLPPSLSAINLAPGRLNSWRFEAQDQPYPDLPTYCLIGDVFVVDGPLEDHVDLFDPDSDPLDNDGDAAANLPHPDDATWPTPPTPAQRVAQLRAWNAETVIHGRININTAPLRALCALPLLANTANAVDAERERLRFAGELVAYRDRLGAIPVDGGNLGNNAYDGGRGIVQNVPGALGTPREDVGFAAAGEAAVPLRRLFSSSQTDAYAPAATAYAYAVGPGGTDDGFALGPDAPSGDVTKYDLRYAYASNLIAVNSDVYCAYIRVQKGPHADPRALRNYVAIFDRSNCVTDNDRPILRAFVQIR